MALRCSAYHKRSSDCTDAATLHPLGGTLLGDLSDYARSLCGMHGNIYDRVSDPRLALRLLSGALAMWCMT